jgi:hypothetical protein
MVEVQITALKDSPAVLAGISIALENVVPGELDFLFWEPIEKAQEDNAWHTYLKRHRMDAVRVRLLSGKIAPLREAKCLKVAALAVTDDLGMPFEQESQGSSDSANIDRLPEAVKDQHMLVQIRGH